MDIDRIKRVMYAMKSRGAMDPDTASNMLLGLLLDVYGQGKEDSTNTLSTSKSISVMVEGTRNV